MSSTATHVRGVFFAGVLAVFLLCGVSDAATFRVTTGANDGVGSLRQAVLDANANNEADTIEIDVSVKEIALSSAIEIVADVDVRASGTTIRGSKVSRLFGISGGTAKFDRLTFVDGYPLSESGGAFYIDSSAGKGDFVNCTFFNNRAGKSGGAVYLYGGGLRETTFTNCTLTGNEAAESGGGVAVSGGMVRFTATIVTGNKAPVDDDVYTAANGIVVNSGQYNVVGKTNAGASFSSALNNSMGVNAVDVFKTPNELTTVDGVSVMPLLSATGNAALDLIPAANALALPTIDERGASRPQMIAIDAGAYELSPVALASIDLVGGTYIQKGTSEKYKVLVYPEDTTLDVRNYENGIEWTVVNPLYGEVVSVDRFGNVTGLSAGEATLRATAHGWDSKGLTRTATDTVSITVGDQPLPRPTVSVSFSNEKTSMAIDEQHTLKLNITVEPKDTPYTVLFESSDPVTATVYQSSLASTTAVLKARNVGQTVVRVTLTAENSKGQASDFDEFLLTVENKKSSGGGGGCNGGFGIAVFALAALCFIKQNT